jgi:hypothetical protein
VTEVREPVAAPSQISAGAHALAADVKRRGAALRRGRRSAATEGAEMVDLHGEKSGGAGDLCSCGGAAGWGESG